MAEPNRERTLEETIRGQGRTRLARYGPLAALAAVVLLAVLLVARCAGGPPRPRFITSQVRRGDIIVTVSATGNLTPTRQIDVGSEISGIVLSTPVDANDQVRRNQVLAIIDPSRLNDAVTRSLAALEANEAAVAQAQATLAESDAQLARLREVSRLSSGQVPSATELATAVATARRSRAALLSARANVVSARAQLSSDRTQVGKAVIRSPVDGVVLKRSIDPGQTVQASFNTPSLFIVAEDLRRMKLEVAVDEADVAQVREGQVASFTVDAYPGRNFPATISRVNLGAKNLSGSSSTSGSSVVSYLASLKFSNADLTLRPGMTATASIEAATTRAALLVPNAALRFDLAGPSALKRPGGLHLGPPAAPGSLPVAQQASVIGVGSHQRVFVVDAAGHPRRVDVVTGRSDGRDTAVAPRVAGRLAPGMVVITGQAAPAPNG